MATSQKLTDHFLTCTVCAEIFTDPCTLECLHTFCRKCVASFTKTQPDAVQARSIPCPVCRKWTSVQNPSTAVDHWPDDIKPIFLIQGLLDSFGPSSKDTTFCTYCKAVGETTPATAWCSVCDDSLCAKCILMHKRIPATRNHDVTDLSAEVKVKRTRKVTCTEHPNEYVEFHCKDCRKAICHKCCITYHRTCKSVVTMESEMDEMKAHLARKKEAMMMRKNAFSETVESHKSKVCALIKMHVDTETEIKSACESVIDEIRQKQTRLLAQLTSVKQEETEKLRVAIKTGEMAMDMIQQQSELIDQAGKSDCEMDIYEIYQSCESGIFDEIVSDGKVTKPLARIRFRNDSAKIKDSLHELDLGEIDFMYEEGLDFQANPVLQDTVKVTLSGHEFHASPADVKVLDVNGINIVVVTDWKNSSVKSFYSRNNQQCHSKLSLEDDPWSLTQLKQNQVAVTVPDTKQIVTIEVNPDLNLLSTISTSREYFGITALTSTKLAAGTSTPPSVDILDTEGTILKSIIPFNNDQSVLINPDFLCSTMNGNILVSDRGSKSVLCLTPEGEVIFNFNPSGEKELGPRSVATTVAGDILVTDYNSCRVILLTESGQFVRNILTLENISKPSGLSLDGHGNIYVTLYCTGLIKRFRMGK